MYWKYYFLCFLMPIPKGCETGKNFDRKKWHVFSAFFDCMLEMIVSYRPIWSQFEFVSLVCILPQYYGKCPVTSCISFTCLHTHPPVQMHYQFIAFSNCCLLEASLLLFWTDQNQSCMLFSVCWGQSNLITPCQKNSCKLGVTEIDFLGYCWHLSFQLTSLYLL